MKSNRSLLIALSILVFLMMVGLPVSGQDTDQLTMEKAVLNAFIEAEAARDYEAMRDLFVEDFVRHSSATTAIAPEASINSFDEYVVFLQETATLFPDYANTLVLVAAEEDYIGFCLEFNGTFSGTGNTLNVPIMGFLRFEGDKIAEMWVEWDNVTWNTQMGVTDAQRADAMRVMVEDLWVNHNLDVLDTLTPQRATWCAGLTGYECSVMDSQFRKSWMELYWAAFPDMRAEVVDVSIVGNKVYAELRFSGTFEHAFMEPMTGEMIPATNQYEHWSLLWIMTVHQADNSLVKEQWFMYFDNWAIRPLESLS